MTAPQILALGMVAASRIDIRSISEPTRQRFIDLAMMDPPLVDIDDSWIFITEAGRRYLSLSRQGQS